MVNIRLAKPEDCQSIFDLIVELAIFEKASDKVTNSPARLLEDGFGEQPSFICFIAEKEGVIVGISFCYTRYSTWIGKCLYLEDLLVTAHLRNQGIGSQLFEYTLAYGKVNHFKRVNWQVLDWNESAINFYKKTNAVFDSEWINVYVEL